MVALIDGTANAVQIGGALAIALATLEVLKYAIGRIGGNGEKHAEREARKAVYALQRSLAEMAVRDESHQRDLEVGIKALSDVLTLQPRLMETVDRRLELIERRD